MSSPPSADPNPSAGQGQSHGAAPTRHRPKYLLLALLLTLLFGVGRCHEGSDYLFFYRAERDPGPALNGTIEDPADRERVEGLYQNFTAAADQARNRAIPIYAASFVLGIALLALAASALSGRSNTRSALMQLVAAQAILVIASYFLIPAMHKTELEWRLEWSIVRQRAAMTADDFTRVSQQMHAARRWGPPTWLTVRTVASALVVLALSRPRAREFFEAAESAAPGS